MGDLEKTIHYTTKAQEICTNLIPYITKEVQLIEPFVGEGDLIALFPEHNWEKYDVEDNGDNIVQDTLLFPPCYTNKWVVTNPPYLAKNKAENKEIFATALLHIKSFDFERVYRRLFENIFNPILDRFGYPEDDRKYVMIYYLNGINAISSEWVKDGCEKTITKISDIIACCVFGKNYKDQ